MPAWRDKPVDSIAPSDVKALISTSPRVAIHGAERAHRRQVFFDWALDEASPAAALRPEENRPVKKPRQRLLTDDEIAAFWKGTDGLGYPYRDLYRLLLLTGVRLREGAGRGMRRSTRRSASGRSLRSASRATRRTSCHSPTR